MVGAYDDADTYGRNAGAAYVFARGADWAEGPANLVARIYPRMGTRTIGSVAGWPSAATQWWSG
jgi:hypothetical protein